MRKNRILVNKPIYLGLPILYLSKTVTYQNCYDYVKTEDIYKDITEEVETRFGTSNLELDRPLRKGKN